MFLRLFFEFLQERLLVLLEQRVELVFVLRLLAPLRSLLVLRLLNQLLVLFILLLFYLFFRFSFTLCIAFLQQRVHFFFSRL